MKQKSVKLIFALVLFLTTGSAQEIPSSVSFALKNDDSTALVSLVSKSSVNDCYLERLWQYSLLSLAVRYNAPRCINLLFDLEADPNKVCEGYLPPLMFAAKYGRLEIIKKLVAKGADVSYVYHGKYEPADGLNAVQYAENFNQSEVANYLRGF